MAAEPLRWQGGAPSLLPQRKKGHAGHRKIASNAAHARSLASHALQHWQLDESPCGVDVDIDLDVYGATVFSVVYDLAQLSSGISFDGLSTRLIMMRLFFVLLCLLANFTLQVGMLYWIYIYVVLGAVNSLERMYKAYHADVFINGTFSHELWETWPSRIDMCNIPFSNFGFMHAILSLWWMTMLKELRKNEQILRDLAAIPQTNDPRCIVEKSVDGKNRIKFLTRSVRVILHVVMVFPKLIIGFALLIIGSIWLTATTTFVDLILNAIALEFVVGIDELLFEALLPAFIHDRIRQTKLHKQTRKPTIEQKRTRFATGYRRSFIYLFGTVFGVTAFLTIGQTLPVLGVLPGYENDLHCGAVVEKLHTRLCTLGVDCFPVS